MPIGIDLGGTKIEGLLLDAEGRERARRRVATPRNDYVGTVAAVADLAAALAAESGGGHETVGIGMPGAIDRDTGLVKNANSTWLNGRPFDRDVAAALARPVACANDADCFTLSEARDGAGEGAAIVFGVILGTGCGGGIAVGAEPLGGPNGLTGEWGHNPLPWYDPETDGPAPECYCGKAGCIETWVSGPGLSALHARATGEDLTVEEIAAAAAAGDAAAEATLSAHADRLARGLAHVVNLLDPDAIVLGGGLSNLDRLYTDVPALMQRWVFSPVETRLSLRRNRHGDSSGVRGAAWLGAAAERAEHGAWAEDRR